MYVSHSDDVTPSSHSSPFVVLSYESSTSSPTHIDSKTTGADADADSFSLPDAPTTDRVVFSTATKYVEVASVTSAAVNPATHGDLPAAADTVGLQLPIGVIIVIVLAAACLLLGAVYGYIYFTRTGARSTTAPSTSKARKSPSGSGGAGGSGSDHHHHHHHHHLSGDAGHDDADGPYLNTHVFLFRKHSGRHHAASIT